ncbi:MAG: hypothetical protein AAF801_11790, partial [Pseudomonadota bacterium]
MSKPFLHQDGVLSGNSEIRARQGRYNLMLYPDCFNKEKSSIFFWQAFDWAARRNSTVFTRIAAVAGRHSGPV